MNRIERQSCFRLRSADFTKTRILASPFFPVQVVMLMLACLLCACASTQPFPAAQGRDPANSLAAFLMNADRQAETDEQRKEIQGALRDMLDKSPAALVQMRYADYAGQTNAWSITELVRHYFVPNPRTTFDDSQFPQEVRAPEARAAIQHQLDEVSRALP